MNAFIEKMREINPEAVTLDGLDDAIIGIAYRPCNQAVLAYDREKCIQVVMKRDKSSYEDAQEFLDFNTFDAYVGEFTPVFLDTEV